MAWIWSKLRGIGGNPDEHAVEDEGPGRESAGDAEEHYLSESAYGAGFAAGDAAQTAQADLDEFKPPRP